MCLSNKGRKQQQENITCFTAKLNTKQRNIQLRLIITCGCAFIMQILVTAFMHNCTTLRHQSAER